MSDYIVHTQSEIERMLEVCKVSNIEELFSEIPADLRAKALVMPKGKAQLEVMQELKQLAKMNKQYDCILRGAGSYNHYIPAVVGRLASRSEFVTAYTPYQAEMSQGILQSIFEYQSMIANMCGLDISNASLYDGATACVEAVIMCVDKKRKKVVVSANINPETMAVLETHLRPINIDIIVVGDKGKTNTSDIAVAIDEEVACVYIEQPNFYGIIEEAQEIGAIVADTKALYIMGVNPISLGVLKNPLECGADIAVGEGQPLGLPMSFGGPYLGFMATTSKLMRKLPGRIVGETVDREGKRAFVLTLQAREQHIRREKALSNICSNQALCALQASIYLAAMGKQGMKDVAVSCLSKAHYAKDAFIATGKCSVAYEDEFFHEFVLNTSVKADSILKALENMNILGGLKIADNQILWCVTEMVTKEQIDDVASIIKGVA